tara:strand:- start:10 stop:654 length:645 start_codon:yes stop_codon:yes gene_type:complete
METFTAAKLTQLIPLAASLLFSGSVFGDSFKTISRTIDVSLIASIEIQAGVAEMDIEFYDGDVIELEIELEAERRWFALRRGNVDEVELEVHTSDAHIYLGIQDQKVQQRWRMRMPSKLALAIDVGVGEIELEDFSNNLEMEVGVGSVRVDIDDTDYAMIRLSVGVGDASIEGFGQQRVDNERSFVSADASYQGDGEMEINIDLGVGEAVVRRR